MTAELAARADGPVECAGVGLYQEMMPEARERRIRKVSLDGTLPGRPELHCEAHVTGLVLATFGWAGQFRPKAAKSGPRLPAWLPRSG